MESLSPGQYFYAPDAEGEQYTFDTFESGHMVKVLRKKAGDEIALTDGRGRVYRARILTATPRRVTVAILQSREVPPPARKLHVWIAPTKQIDRFEWFLEKATELGVWEITPLRTARTERKQLNFERLEKIIVSAVKQSLRAYKPRLNPWKTLAEVQAPSGQGFVALCRAETYHNRAFRQAPRASVVIGPEGGFTPSEQSLLIDKGFLPLRLGAHRLRTETAGVASVCQFYTCNL